MQDCDHSAALTSCHQVVEHEYWAHYGLVVVAGKENLSLKKNNIIIFKPLLTVYGILDCILDIPLRLVSYSSGYQFYSILFYTKSVLIIVYNNMVYSIIMVYFIIE